MKKIIFFLLALAAFSSAVDLAYGKACYRSTGTCTNAFDNNNATQWAFNDATAMHNVTVDLNATYDYNVTNIEFYSYPGAEYAYLGNVSIYYSTDNFSSSNVFLVHFANGSNNNHSFMTVNNGNGVTARYWRLAGKNPAGDGNWAYLAYFNIDGTMNAPTDTTPPTVVINQPSDDSVLTVDGALSINGTATDETALSAIWTNSSVWSIYDTASPFNVTNVSAFSYDTTYSVNVSANDTAGNVGWDTVTFEIDNTAPSYFVAVAPTSANNTFWSRDWNYINTTFDENNPVDCFFWVNATTRYAMSLSSTEDYCFANFTSLAQGEYFGHVQVVDEAGNNGNSSQLRHILDTTAPSTSNILPANHTFLSGVEASNYTVNFTPDDAHMQYAFSNSTVWTQNLTSSGSPLSFSNQTAATNAVYSLLFSLYDFAGNVFNFALSFVTDQTPPTITITAPLNQTYTGSDAGVSLNGTYVETNFAFLVTNDSAYTTNYTSTSPFSLTNTSTLTQGNHSVLFTIRDLAGNLNYASVNFVYDTISPSTLTFVAPTLGNYTVQPQNYSYINVTFTESNPANCTLWQNATTATSMTLTGVSGDTYSCYVNKTSLNEGEYHWTVQVIDAANKLVNSSSNVAILDTTAPASLTAVSPLYANGTTHPQDWIYYNYTFVELHPANSTLWVNGTAYAMTIKDNSVYLNRTSLAQGSYFAFTQFFDNASNQQNSTMLKHTLDTSAPSGLTWVSPTYGNDTVVSQNFVYLNATFTESTGSPNATAWINGTAYAATVRNNYAYYNYTTGVNGSYFYFLQVMDNASNTANTSMRKIILDTANPTITLRSPTNEGGNNNNSVTGTWFYYSATDNNGFANVSLYHNATGNFVLNVSNTSAFTNGTVTLFNSTNLAQNEINWNIYVCDNAGNCDWDTNRTVYIDRSSPQTSYASNTSVNYLNQTGLSNWVFVNLTITEPHIETITAQFCSTTNCTNYSITTNDSINYWRNVTLSSNFTYNYTLYINDKAGNSNTTSERSARITNVPWHMEGSVLYEGNFGYGNDVYLTARLCDPDGVSSYILTENATTPSGALANDTVTTFTDSMSGGCALLNVTKTGWGSQYETKNFAWGVYFNNTRGNWNSTNTSNYLTITGTTYQPPATGGGGGGATYVVQTPNASVAQTFTKVGNASSYYDFITGRLKGELNATTGDDTFSNTKRGMIESVLNFREYVQGETKYEDKTIPNAIFPLLLFGGGAFFTAGVRRYDGSTETDFSKNSISLVFVFLSIMTLVLVVVK